MKLLIRSLGTFLATLAIVAAVSAGEYTEGKEYERLATPQPTVDPERIEVVELFWYGCPHCYDLEPLVNKWLAGKPDDVVFVRMPAIVGPRWELLAKAYFTAQALGVLEKIHPALFAAIHEKHQKINDEAALQDFFATQGIGEKEFKEAFNSFAVAFKVNNAKLMTRRYAISGVPTIIVNGKFRTSGKLTGGNEELFEVVDYLVNAERAAAEPAQAATAGD
ncbi:MAG: thiol:disulfide interchange protein DsbA/DsbL [Gammaproteobacteria bacterium]|jgi:thiol:disulfide interchange protein DsbA